MNFENLNLLIHQDLKHNNVPMLVGEPGIGKSSWVEHFAESEGTRCFTLACNQLADKADLTGCRLVPVGKNKNGEEDYAQVFYPHKVIRDACEYAEAHPNENPILFLDEINRSTPDVTSEALSIPTMRCIGGRKIPQNLKVIIAGNDKGNVTALDKASITRFVLYRIVPDANTFCKVNKDINPYVLAVLKKNPEYIYCDAVTLAGVTSGNGDDDDDEGGVADFDIEFDDQLSQMTTPRTITATSRWLNEYTYDELMQMLNTPTTDSTLLKDALIAHCGETPFTFAVLEEIINSSVVANTAAASAVPTVPAKYQVLCNAKTRNDIVDIIDGATDDEKSELLIYCIYDKRDNHEILNVLAPAVVKIMPKDMNMLTACVGAKTLDKGNLDYLMQQSCQIVSLLQMLNI